MFSKFLLNMIVNENWWNYQLFSQRVFNDSRSALHFMGERARPFDFGAVCSFPEEFVSIKDKFPVTLSSFQVVISSVVAWKETQKEN